MAPAKRVAFALLLAAAATAGSAAQADVEQAINVDGSPRTFRLHVPRGGGDRALPLVVVFHGGGGNAASAARMSGMDAKADEARFLAAYPNGTGRGRAPFLTWNTWQCCGPALDDAVDDVRFTRAMVEWISREYRVDPRRIYATGMSNGAMMAYRVACELSDVFAAVAPVSGALDTDDCSPRSPVSAIVFHGTADRHIRYGGGKPIVSMDRRHSRDDKPVAFAVGFWSRYDLCKAEPSRTRHGHIVHDVYDCPEGAGVELYSIDGGGHAWPGVTNGEISATNLMWDFFEKHPKP